ncbi:hypothetical protein EG349_16685 [Chryseobacterium shandongense]|uniref:Uncharacterized protein n=1 Tax=Chryseobacterium shandongense TaxID=1493872 RepID=A0AAD0YJX0_9FLAO|nr:T6SS effector amidase Tae4 family protein [Chryseobacterium shandongense]AZA88291.1 hypothetical protein EG349_16685 [Chryseobacterium shandongense]AZA96852.1 hypothetical protein EG353_15475 [Chryseobacterium shandongense]
MKKTYFLMLLALVFLVFSCRSELDNLQENESKSVSSKKSFSSRLISLKTVQEEVKSFNSIQAKFTNSKLAKSVTAKSFNNNYLYRKLENTETGTITYTLPLNSYSAAKPYYFIQQIIVASSDMETVQYLKIIPNNAPAYKTQDVLKNLTGSIELYDENLEMVTSTAYVNGVAQTTASSGSGNTTGKTNGECDVDIITIEVPCSTSGQHGVGESCDPGITNDAHYETTIYVTCPHTFGPPTVNTGGGSGGGSLGGGYVFDEQLNSLLTNPTFLYGDYITSPNHELLLQAVRAWIPNHVTDINGDLSDLNQRIEHFFNNDELFTNLVTYNQNTPNVPNAEAEDYSIRVYELIKWLLNNPSPQNGQLAAWGVSYFDQNRFVSWEQFENWFAGTSEGKDGEDYDAAYWDDPNLTFPTQNLPSWQNYYNAFPKDSNGNGLPGPNIYNIVGGVPKAMRDGVLSDSNPNNDRDYDNACALRVSRALNYSGVIIPNLPNQTFKGAEGKYYFLSAKKLNAWMRKTFGTNPATQNTPFNPKHIHITGIQAGVHGANLPNLLGGKKGIYSLVSSDSNWASGHGDILLPNATCINGCHFFDAPIAYIDVWILQ